MVCSVTDMACGDGGKEEEGGGATFSCLVDLIHPLLGLGQI